MAQSRLDLIQTLDGTGQLVIEGRTMTVRYTVRIFQEVLEVSPGNAVLGLKSATGKFADLKTADAVKVVGRSGQLVFDDGQKAEVIVTDSNGTFLVSGQIG